MSIAVKETLVVILGENGMMCSMAMLSRAVQWTAGLAAGAR